MYLAGRGGSRAWSGIKTRLAERAAAKQSAADAAEREAARAAEEREWAAATEAERASAPDRTKRAIETAAADEERESAARRKTLERRAVEDGAIEREAKEAARTEQGARDYIERVTCRGRLSLFSQEAPRLWHSRASCSRGGRAERCGLFVSRLILRCRFLARFLPQCELQLINKLF